MLFLVEVGFAFAASELSSFGSDTQVAKTLFIWGWNSAVLFAPPFGAMVAATTLATLGFRVLPRWFGWFSLFVLIGLVVLALLGIPGLGAGVGLIWLLVASAALYLAV